MSYSVTGKQSVNGIVIRKIEKWYILMQAIHHTRNNQSNIEMKYHEFDKIDDE